jgi:23S rRNA pseudouridine1911/1915/1917 synthase
MNKKITIKQEEVGERLDFYLASKFSDYSRNFFSKLIKENQILVNKNTIKSSYQLQAGDEIAINFTEIISQKKLQGEKIPLDIIFENNDVIVINKQPGLVVHPASGHPSGTLVNALVEHFPQIKKVVFDPTKEISKNRPGLVHRLDKDTSGVIIVAKNPRTMHSLTKQIQNRTTEKKYWAICYGWPKNAEDKLVNFLGRHPKNRKLITEIGSEKGKEAISLYKVVKYLKDNLGEKISLIEFNILTGRTHQIRVQVNLLGHPVLGDDSYGNKTSKRMAQRLKINRQMLHAKSLKIYLPDEKNPRIFEAPLPNDFLSILDNLKEIN